MQLENLEQGGGGVISVQTLDGAMFDAIVFGEREPRNVDGWQQWVCPHDAIHRD